MTCQTRSLSFPSVEEWARAHDRRITAFVLTNQDDDDSLGRNHTVDSNPHTCPHHPSTALWYWAPKCAQCSHSVCPDVPDYRFARWPLNGVYSTSVKSLPPISNEDTKPSLESRGSRRRRSLASKYPYTYPRKGSDTNPSTLTGRVLSIYREGLSTIGRRFIVIPTSIPWKC